MGHELIIAEKPQAARKIAEALADTKPSVTKEGQVSYYTLSHGKQKIVVASAVGHIFGLAEKNKKGWTYPVYDIEWKASADMDKSAAYTKKYLQVLKKLSKDADAFTVATDFDTEGEVIGLNVVRYACKQKDANRMKFSTLTKGDLVAAYENKQPHLEWGQAKAGETRHILDWYYGINLSRAFTLAVKKALGGFKILSVGRVQGPALKLVTDKEKEIQAFVPKPYWEIQFAGTTNKAPVEGKHKEDKFWDEKQAAKVFETVKDEKSGVVSEINTRKSKHSVPVPFDLTTLQTEVFRVFKIKPKETLALAQNLYIGGFISYPRTSSQKLPSKIGYKDLLTKIARSEKYKALAEELLGQKSLTPKEGKKTDDAHPAIYPTGILPDTLTASERKVYDIIVKRFMAVFSTDAVRETMKVTVSIKEEPFIVEGTRTVEKNWHRFYEPYVLLSDVELPAMPEGTTVLISSLTKESKETSPPKRYTESSIIRALEKENLGTKATRATIVETLFARGYIAPDPIRATELGMHTISTLEKYVPEIVSSDMTRTFEEEMEQIRKDETTDEAVLAGARQGLDKVLASFKKHEGDVGKELGDAERTSRDKANTIGACPSCNKGKLQMKKSKYGRFIGCSEYPDCKAAFPLPPKGKITPTKESCPYCSHPLVIEKQMKQNQRYVCINPKCKTWTPEFQASEEGQKFFKVAKKA